MTRNEIYNEIEKLCEAEGVVPNPEIKQLFGTEKEYHGRVMSMTTQNPRVTELVAKWNETPEGQ